MAPRDTPIFFKLYLSDPEIPYLAASLTPVGATGWSYMINGQLNDLRFDTARQAEAAGLEVIRGALLAGLDQTHRHGVDLHPTRERDRDDPTSPQSENYLVSLTSRAGHTLTLRTSRKKALRYIAAAKREGAKIKHRRPVVQEPTGHKRNAEEWRVIFNGKNRCHIITLACRAAKRRPDPIMARSAMPELDPHRPWWDQ